MPPGPFGLRLRRWGALGISRAEPSFTGWVYKSTMRSSKSRSRNKQRNRSVGNIVNRVFDSSGPEGKVRGTPQQIIDKYNQLARDAQLGGDRVATENFQQHAEHYTRLLAEAQREQNERREQQEAQARERQQMRAEQMRHDEGAQPDAQPQPHHQNDGGHQGASESKQPDPQGNDHARHEQPPAAQDDEKSGRGRGRRKAKSADAPPSDVIDLSQSEQGESGLVETPEEKPKRKPRARKPKASPEESGPASDATAAE